MKHQPKWVWQASAGRNIIRLISLSYCRGIVHISVIQYAPMKIARTLNELHALIPPSSNIGLVPTMGNLHEGHLDLVRTAKQHASCVVVSIFVNPLQFGPKEDLASYPRTLDADIAKLTDVGADILFAPAVEDVYPEPQTMRVVVGEMANTLCGLSRPGHFDGVATVVMKLFNLVRPNVAVFGRKDFQQLKIITQMVRQFNLPIHIIAQATKRESDGLAMSSRNGYLSSAERMEAPRLNRALVLIAQAIQAGQLDYAALEQQTTQYLTQLGWIVDYIAVRSADTLQPASQDDADLVVLAAARLGKTRLIDNLEITLAT